MLCVYGKACVQTKVPGPEVMTSLQSEVVCNMGREGDTQTWTGDGSPLVKAFGSLGVRCEDLPARGRGHPGVVEVKSGQ